jgi:hypothetical protein
VNETWQWIEFYASRGLRVLPVWGIAANGTCLCPKGAACGKTSGKHPIPEKWQTVATSNHTALQLWWQRYPEANIGIATSADDRRRRPAEWR